jgi:hypothetical protein
MGHIVWARLSKDIIVDQPLSAQDYSFVDFGDFDLAMHSLERSNLSYTNLSKSTGLTEEKLAGQIYVEPYCPLI